MNIGVIGKNGQLAQSFASLTQNNKDIQFFSKSDLDITNLENTLKTFSTSNFNIIINCSAFTNVEGAEGQVDEAFNINRDGVRNLCLSCEKYDIFLIHFSTDYVFDGAKDSPYIEADSTNPLSVYGASKLAGEMEILQSNVNSLIVRTSWLFSQFGQNFVKTIVNNLNKDKKLSVVHDQIGTPTSALDLARVVLNLIDNNKLPKLTEILNISNSGECSWFDFASEIKNYDQTHGQVEPTTTEKYGFIAKRPKFSVLSKEKLASNYSISMRSWQASLNEIMNILKKSPN